ncbi:hypothetical protein CesoFtcFv8_002565 [Champsocephalus esox]|uniref:Uncharacterized protein n=1 Tax=Champsocephalus esox TaxID=159716 RepID=A0AAN8CZ95_9TELE|nr:hypothetical protein CesoFtcFv8_002565 [Champsocephalus esox]
MSLLLGRGALQRSSGMDETVLQCSSEASSHLANNFHNNMFLDSGVVTLLNHATSVFAGFDIFSILGHIAHIYGKPVAAVVKEGFGLAFIVFPDTLAKLPSLVHLSFFYVHHSWPGLSVYMFRGAHHLPVGCFP